MDASDARRLKELDEDNRRQKRMVAGLGLDGQMLEDVFSKKLLTPAAKHPAAGHSTETHTVSEHGASRLMKLHRSVARYCCVSQHDDSALRCRMQALRGAVRRSKSSESRSVGSRAPCARRTESLPLRICRTISS